MEKHWVRWTGGLALALGGLGAAWWGIRQNEAGLKRRYFNLNGGTDEGGVSALAFEPENATEKTPALLIAHGFSGCKELMQVIGSEVARRGFRTYLFDFAGHGAAPSPLVPPKNLDFSPVLNANTRTVERVYDYVKQNFPKADVGVLGHSMGSGAITNFATQHPELKATIPVSPVGDAPLTASNPQNLLGLVGQRDIPFSIDTAKRWLQKSTAHKGAKYGETTGKFEKGTARRFEMLPGLDHISILFAPPTTRAINEWLEKSFRLDGAYQNRTAERLGWTGLGMATAFASFFPFSRLATALAGGKGPDQKESSAKFVDHAGAMALLLGSHFASALILNRVKTPRLVRLQLGDYVASFFGLSGLLTWIGLGIFGGKRLQLSQMSRKLKEGAGTKVSAWVLLPAALWLFVYATLGQFSKRSWNSFTLTPVRARAMAIIALSMLPYFLADEFVYRRIGGWKGYALGLLGKIGVVGALVMAVRMRPELGFLMILLLPLVVTFGLFGLCAASQYKQGGDFVTSAVFQTLVFAWVVSTLFPVI